MKKVLIFLLILAPTIQYRVELGAFSFALMEPVALGVSAILLLDMLRGRDRLIILKDPLVFLFLGMTLWASLIRPWSADHTHGLSDVRDWAIPVIGFVALVSSIRSGWHKVVRMILFIGFLQSLAALYQAQTNSFRVFVGGGTALYKTVFLPGVDDTFALASYGVGFFAHPNGFGYFMSVVLLLWLGVFLASTWRIRVFLAPVGALMAAAMVLSYAKTAIIVFALAVLLLIALRFKQLKYAVPLVASAGLLVSLLLPFIVAISSTSYSPFGLTTIGWRFRLWGDTLRLLGHKPLILLFGNGDTDLEALWAIPFLHPHNLFLYFLLYYGLPGLLCLMLFAFILHRSGFAALPHLQHNPVLASLYISLAMLLVGGIVEVIPQDINQRMLLLIFCSGFIGLKHEVGEYPARYLALRYA